MAFHVRLSKHNVFKLQRVRSLQFVTQADDRRFERRSVIHVALSDSADRKTLALSDVHHGSWRCLGTNRPHMMYRAADGRSSYVTVNSTASSKCFSTVVGSQEQEQQDICENGTSTPCSCMLNRSRSLECRKNCLPEKCHNKSFLPMTLSDLQAVLLSEWPSVKEDTNFSSYVKQVSHTGDDILADNDLCDPHRVSPCVISQENHDVTVLNQFLNTYIPRNSYTNFSSVFCQGVGTQEEKGKPKRSGPSEEQLVVVEKFFAATLPTFLKSRQEYSIFHKDIVLENNFWKKPVVTQGINGYVMQMSKIRILAHLKYSYAQTHILKITRHPEDGTVRIRWRIVGLPQLKTLQFWKFMPWNYRENKDSMSEWHDGFSIMTVGTDGLVHKHRVDRVMPDEDTETAKRVNLAAKLALLFGLSPKPSLNDFSSLFMKKHMLSPK